MDSCCGTYDAEMLPPTASAERRRIQPNIGSRWLGRLVAAVGMALIATLGLLVTPPAQAVRPAGNWTFVNYDGYAHYACKTYVSNSPYGPLYRVRTLTSANGRPVPTGQGTDQQQVDIAIYRYNDHNPIGWKYNRGWIYGFNGNEIYASALLNDRLWMQHDGYGPSRYFTDGVPVRRLANC